MLQVGASKLDITPEPGVELCGFANRTQPSSRVLDQLYVSVLFLKEGKAGFFLINLDLIGIEREFTEAIRKKIRIKYHIAENHIQIFATHTHSGPGTIHLNYCGEYNSGYMDLLDEKILQACGNAIENREECSAFFEEEEFELGIDRRNRTPLVLKLKCLVFKLPDESAKGLLINYPMHPVCLKTTGISSDYPGVIKRMLEENLDGNPVVLFALGAAGDIDPPEVGVDYGKMEEWGEMLVQGLGTGDSGLGIWDWGLGAGDSGIQGQIRVQTKKVGSSVQVLSEEEIDAYADKYLADSKWDNEFGGIFDLAVEKWRRDMKLKIREENVVLEIGLLKIGLLKLVFINAELFSQFERILQDKIQSPFMVISCANGLEGYFPSTEEYEKGGYEVETAIFFYNSFRPLPDSLMKIAEETIEMINH